jgi:hypothetical protein
MYIYLIKTSVMKFLSLQPFIPSGKDFDAAKQFFIELGFTLSWDGVDYAGLTRDGCSFILQKYDNKAFADNLMISINLTDVAAFEREITSKDLSKRFNVKIGSITQQPYGKELNIIDAAGVCWHFVEG